MKLEKKKTKFKVGGVAFTYDKNLTQHQNILLKIMKWYAKDI